MVGCQRLPERVLGQDIGQVVIGRPLVDGIGQIDDAGEIRHQRLRQPLNLGRFLFGQLHTGHCTASEVCVKSGQEARVVRRKARAHIQVQRRIPNKIRIQ